MKSIFCLAQERFGKSLFDLDSGEFTTLFALSIEAIHRSCFFTVNPEEVPDKEYLYSEGLVIRPKQQILTSACELIDLPETRALIEGMYVNTVFCKTGPDEFRYPKFHIERRQHRLPKIKARVRKIRPLVD